MATLFPKVSSKFCLSQEVPPHLHSITRLAKTAQHILYLKIYLLYIFLPHSTSRDILDRTCLTQRVFIKLSVITFQPESAFQNNLYTRTSFPHPLDVGIKSQISHPLCKNYVFTVLSTDSHMSLKIIDS